MKRIPAYPLLRWVTRSAAAVKVELLVLIDKFTKRKHSMDSKGRWRAVFAFSALLWAGGLRAQDASIDVLHWWTSASERRAADHLSAQLAAQNVQWKDAAVPGGGGVAAGKVLRSRVLLGDPPGVAQLIGTTLTVWFDAGLVLPLDEVASRQRWSQALFPTVLDVVQYRGRVVAAPLGVHRINTMLFNRRVFSRLGLAVPTNWTSFESVARQIAGAGIRPLAWSDEPWQIATVFESVLLGEVGVKRYRELILQRQASTWMDPGVERALVRLRWLRAVGTSEPKERAWTDSARELMADGAAMMIMGDWAKGELMAWGANPEIDFGCQAVPGTDGMHLYSVDTLAMMVGAKQRQAVQEKVAETVVSLATQQSYNRIKGSVPVRKDIDVSALDVCARDSWRVFSASPSKHAPSLAHRMAADDATKDAVAQILWRYLTTPTTSAQEAQQRLAMMIRAPGAKR